ncbi:hypothetical protein DENSPDRAFT_505521 [Dentipellis sp. KUC8613]|nr:hypothetical protein DENSPDRAFT_505521 [Dentipellis sp. KUC8613]
MKDVEEDWSDDIRTMDQVVRFRTYRAKKGVFLSKHRRNGKTSVCKTQLPKGSGNCSPNPGNSGFDAARAGSNRTCRSPLHPWEAVRRWSTLQVLRRCRILRRHTSRGQRRTVQDRPDRCCIACIVRYALDFILGCRLCGAVIPPFVGGYAWDSPEEIMGRGPKSVSHTSDTETMPRARAKQRICARNPWGTKTCMRCCRVIVLDRGGIKEVGPRGTSNESYLEHCGGFIDRSLLREDSLGARYAMLGDIVSQEDVCIGSAESFCLVSFKSLWRCSLHRVLRPSDHPDLAKILRRGPHD